MLLIAKGQQLLTLSRASNRPRKIDSRQLPLLEESEAKRTNKSAKGAGGKASDVELEGLESDFSEDGWRQPA